MALLPRRAPAALLSAAFLLLLPVPASAQDAGPLPDGVEVVPYDEAEDWPDAAEELLPDLPVEEVAPDPPPPAPALPQVVVPASKVIPGRTALIRADGKAAIPRGAPKRVRQVISAANQIVGRPYKWGGGHARLLDTGYDCSGAVGYALIRTGLMGGSMVSGAMARWAAPGAGRWISVYANKGHVYLEVAGLRLDTSPVGDRPGRKGVRWRPAIGRRTGFVARHPPGL